MKKCFTLLSVLLTTAVASAASWTSPGQGRTYTLLELSKIAASGVEQPLPHFPQNFILNDTLVIASGDTLEIKNKEIISIPDLSGEIIIFGAVRMAPKDSATIRIFTNLLNSVPVRTPALEFKPGASSAEIRNMRFDGIALRWESDSSLDIRDSQFSCVWKRKALSFISSRCPATHVIRDNFFTDCRLAAIGHYSTLSRRPECGMEVAGNHIVNCGDSISNTTPVIDLVSGGAMPVIVQDNTVIGNHFDAGGIRVTNAFDNKGENSVLIKGNTVKGMAYGINTTGGMAVRVIDNVCEDNHYARSTFLGYGIGLFNVISARGIGKTAWVQGNTMKGNPIGLYISGKRSIVNAGNIETPGAEDYNPGENTFDQNGFTKIDGGYTYSPQKPCDVYNDTPNDIFAEGNIWGAGATTDEQIQARIYDYYSKPSLGKVYFRVGQYDFVGVTHDDRVIIAIYDLQGRLHSELQRGVNIVHYSDGSTRKILVY